MGVFYEDCGIGQIICQFKDVLFPRERKDGSGVRAENVIQLENKQKDRRGLLMLLVIKKIKVTACCLL